MIWLDTAATGRDNNLNLIRMVAATAVLVSHAWPQTYGVGVIEPMERLTHHSLGRLSVYVFFAISGFLVAASFTRSATLTRFVAARALRLVPGLLVSLLLVSFVLGPVATRLPLADYLAARGTWTAVLQNITLFSPQFRLPGVFNDNPFPAVQGSIWTLIHEVLCYVMVFLAGIAGAFRTTRRFWVFLAVYAALWTASLMAPVAINPRAILLRDLSLPFVYGMAAWVWRDRLPLMLWGVAALGLAAAALRDTALAYPVLAAFLFYGTFWLAYVPGGILRAYNRLGDYSYGMYIYAFPLQGLVVWLWHPATPLTHIVLALPLTLVAAVLSWHLVERPALGWLKRLPSQTIAPLRP